MGAASRSPVFLLNQGDAQRAVLLAALVQLALSGAAALAAQPLAASQGMTQLPFFMLAYGAVMVPAAKWLAGRHLRWHAKRREALDTRLLLTNAALMWLAFCMWPVAAALLPWALGRLQ